MREVVHHWRWRCARYLITCGARNGLIDVPRGTFNCKRCIRVCKARGWSLDG